MQKVTGIGGVFLKAVNAKALAAWYDKHLGFSLLEELQKERVEVVDEMVQEEYGRFGWILDPEGNKIELWEPFDEKF